MGRGLEHSRRPVRQFWNGRDMFSLQDNGNGFRQAQAPGDQGSRDSTLRIGVPAREHMRAAQAQQPFPVHPQRGGARDNAVEPFGRRCAGCVRVGGHRAGSAA